MNINRHLVVASALTLTLAQASRAQVRVPTEEYARLRRALRSFSTPQDHRPSKELAPLKAPTPPVTTSAASAPGQVSEKLEIGRYSSAAPGLWEPVVTVSPSSQGYALVAKTCMHAGETVFKGRLDVVVKKSGPGIFRGTGDAIHTFVNPISGQPFICKFPYEVVVHSYKDRFYAEELSPDQVQPHATYPTGGYCVVASRSWKTHPDPFLYDGD